MTNKSSSDNKTTILFMINSLVIIILTCYSSIIFKLEWKSLIIGIILMVLSIPFFIFGKKNNQLYKITFLLNTIGVGLSIGTYYMIRNISFDIITPILATIIIGIIGLITLKIIKKIQHNKLISIISIIGIIFFLIGLIFLWIINEQNILYSYTFFITINALFYVILPLSINQMKDNIYQNIAMFSYGVYILITLIILTILSEGDFDFFDFSSNRKKRK